MRKTMAMLLSLAMLLGLVIPAGAVGDVELVYPEPSDLNLEVTAGDEEITLSWTEVPSVEGDTLVEYTAYCYPADGTYEDGIQETCSVGEGSYTCTFTGLTNDVLYNVGVAAVYESGHELDYGADGMPSSADAVLPGVPVIQSAEPAGNGKILVKWTAPENNGGAVILGYEVEAGGESDGTIVGIDGTEEGTMSCTVEGLTNGETYQVTVRAINAKGVGEGATTQVSLPIVPMKLLVGTVTVTEENMDDILGDGTASYNGATNTLTLKNADIHVTAGSNAGIKIYGDLNLILEGENKVSCASYYGIYSNSPLTITGDGSLDVRGTDFGIYTSGYDVAELTIGGSAQVTAQSGDVKSGSSYGIRADGDFVICEDAVVNAQGGRAPARSCGIYAYTEMNIYDRAQVTTTGGAAQSDSYGIRTTYMTVYGGGVTAIASEAAYQSIGIFTQTLDVGEDGTVTARGNITETGPSIGIQAAKTLSIYGDATNVTAVGADNPGGVSQGFNVGETMVVDGGTVTARSGRGHSTHGIEANGLLVSSGSVVAQAGTAGPEDGYSWGIQAYDEGISITGGTVSAQGGQAYSRSYGIQTSGSAQISNAEVTAHGGEADEGFGLWTFGDIVVSRSMGQRTNLTTDVVQFAGELSLDGVQMIQPESYTVEQKGGWIYQICDSQGDPADSVQIVSLFRVSFDSGESQDLIPAQEVADGQQALYPEYDPKLKGYTFLGWYAEGAKGAFDFDTPVSSDMTLQAKWKKKESTYPPVVENTQGGNVTISPVSPKKGDTVTICPNPEAGMVVDSVFVTDKTGNSVDVKDNGDGTYTFTQPAGKVTITVTFGEKPCDGGSGCPAYGFSDVAPGQWYHEGVDYVLTKGLMQGVSDTQFAPMASTTRGMIVTVLWRLDGQPTAQESTFADVSGDAWYAEAVAWAAANGIVTGYTADAFGPNDVMTREQMASVLYRYAQYLGCDVSEGEETNILSFADASSISQYAIPAMEWAVGEGLINGADGKLLPASSAVRAQAATILMRFCENQIG